MKPGKSDVSGTYTSNAILHAPDSFFDALASIFRSFLVLGTISRHLFDFPFLTLLKSNLMDPLSTDSYRAIAGSSQVSGAQFFCNTGFCESGQDNGRPKGVLAQLSKGIPIFSKTSEMQQFSYLRSNT